MKVLDATVERTWIEREAVDRRSLTEEELIEAVELAMAAVTHPVAARDACWLERQARRSPLTTRYVTK